MGSECPQFTSGLSFVKGTTPGSARAQLGGQSGSSWSSPIREATATSGSASDGIPFATESTLDHHGSNDGLHAKTGPGHAPAAYGEGVVSSEVRKPQAACAASASFLVPPSHDVPSQDGTKSCSGSFFGVYGGVSGSQPKCPNAPVQNPKCHDRSSGSSASKPSGGGQQESGYPTQGCCRVYRGYNAPTPKSHSGGPRRSLNPEQRCKALYQRGKLFK